MSSFHPGEIETQIRLGVRADAERVERIVASTIPSSLGRVLAAQRLAVAASLDAQRRPWASLLAGPPGFIAAVDEHRLRLHASPAPDDLLVDNLAVHPDVAVLVIDPRTRLRLRFNGRGLYRPEGLFLAPDQVYGNCQKYIQKRRLLADSPAPPGPTRRGDALDPGQGAAIAAADTFFIASWHPAGGADASHRGGRPGFVEVIDERTLEFPDYPGNNMFNTLGNLAGHPRAGLLFVDFASGDLLQLSGRARVVGKHAVTVRVEVEEVRATPTGTGLRFELVEPSPANPSASSRTGGSGISRGSAGGQPARGG